MNRARFDLQRASHCLGEIPREGQTEAGPAFSKRAGVALDRRGSLQGGYHLGRHSRACITNPHPDPFGRTNHFQTNHSPPEGRI